MLLEPAHNVVTRTLPCGLTVTVDPLPHSGLTSFSLFVDCGVRHEESNENGLAHLVEHAVFLGTKNYEEEQISDIFDAMGGAELNAETDHERTNFMSMILPESLPQALLVVSDMVGCPTFDAEKLEREKRVICSEIYGRGLSASDQLSESIFEAIFPGHSMGRPLAGTIDSVLATTPDDACRFFDSGYRSGAMTLAVCGAVNDLEAVFDAAESSFGRHVRRGKGRSSPAAVFGTPGLQIVTKEEEEPQVGFSLFFPAPSAGTDSSVEASMISLILGTGPSSRLFRRIRQDSGYCYGIFSAWSPFSDAGLFHVEAALQPETAHIAADQIFEVLRSFAEEGPTDEEIERAKRKAKIGIRFVNESPKMRIGMVFSQLSSFGRIRTFSEVEEKIERCSRESVMKLASEIFLDRAVLGLCGPSESCGAIAETASEGNFFFR